MKLSQHVVPVALSLAVAGTSYFHLQPADKAWALSDDWTSCLTPDDPNKDPFDATGQGSGFVEYDYGLGPPAYCDDCTNTEDGSPSAQNLTLEFTTADVDLECDNTDKLAILYIHWCAALPSETQVNTTLGSVFWFAESGLLGSSNLTHASSLMATASWSCLRGNEDLITKVLVSWGSGFGNPSIGEAVKGFELLEWCCDQ